MDKSSPVYENFAKKMDAMRGGPKISKSTMKIGGGMGLEGRVSNNEKKITLLKNIFKAQREDIGERITPKISNLELSLNETTEILNTITDKLSIDMSQRLQDQKALFDAQRKQNLDDKKDKAEKNLEEKKKSKIGSSIAKTVVKPFGDLFNNLLNLAGILGGGLLATNLIGNLNNEEFQQKLEDIFNWTEKNWKTLAIGAGILGGIIIGGAIASFISSMGVVIGIVTNPLFLLALGVIGLSALGDKILDKVTDYYRNDPDGSKNFVGNPPPNAPKNPTRGDFYVDNEGNIWRFDAGLSDSSHGGWVSTGNINSLNKLNQNNSLPEEGTFTDLFGNEYTRRNRTEEYNQNLLDDQSGASLLNFAVKNEELKKLIKEKNLKPSIIELPPIDLTNSKRNMIGKMSNNPATGIPDISSMNFANPYMEEIPDLFGFEDIVYT